MYTHTAAVAPGFSFYPWKILHSNIWFLLNGSSVGNDIFYTFLPWATRISWENISNHAAPELHQIETFSMPSAALPQEFNTTHVASPYSGDWTRAAWVKRVWVVNGQRCLNEESRGKGLKIFSSPQHTDTRNLVLHYSPAELLLLLSRKNILWVSVELYMHSKHIIDKWAYRTAVIIRK